MNKRLPVERLKDILNINFSVGVNMYNENVTCSNVSESILFGY